MRLHRLWLAIVAVVFSLVVFGTSAFTLGQKAGPAPGPALTCDMQQYKIMTGLAAVVQANLLTVTWADSDGSDVRGRYGIDNGQPVVRDLAVRKTGGQWAVAVLPVGEEGTNSRDIRTSRRRGLHAPESGSAPRLNPAARNGTETRGGIVETAGE